MPEFEYATCVLHELDNGQWYSICRTEVIASGSELQWFQGLSMHYRPEEEQQLKLVAYNLCDPAKADHFAKEGAVLWEA